MTARGPRRIGASIGLAVLLLFLLGVPTFFPPALVAAGRPVTAAVISLAVLPVLAFFVAMLAAPDALQRFLARFTKIDLRDGGHVAAATVMALTLFYVIGVQTAAGVLAVEDAYGPRGPLDPPPADAQAGAPPPPVNLTAELLEGDSVFLDWEPPENGTANVTAYVVYRGVSPGAPTSFERVENATNFTNTQVFGGVEYVYVVTAVDAEARESLPSDAARVLVPVNPNLIYTSIIENLIILVLPALFYVSFVHGLGPGAALRSLGFRSDGLGRAILLGIGAVLAFQVLFAIAVGFFQQVQELPENERAQAIGLGVGIGGAFIVATGAAISEEVFYRGFLQPRVGLLGQAIIFAVAHVTYVNVIEVVVVFLLALVFGLLYRYTGSLWAPIAGHFAFNLVNLIAIVCTSDPSACGLG